MLSSSLQKYDLRISQDQSKNSGQNNICSDMGFVLQSTLNLQHPSLGGTIGECNSVQYVRVLHTCTPGQVREADPQKYRAGPSH